MEKKIIKAMYANSVSRDEMHPVMSGVHFEKDRCYASDSHILTIYNGGGCEKLDGKTIDYEGNEIDLRYPNVDAVFPSKEDLKDFGMRIDLEQLQKACSWHLRKKDSNQKDVVTIGAIGIPINGLCKLLSIFVVANEIGKARIYMTEPHRPLVIESKKLRTLIMPAMFETSDVDQDRNDEGAQIVLSYGNLINDYVFNSWQRTPAPAELQWLDN